jgi:hypothetical protein
MYSNLLHYWIILLLAARGTKSAVTVDLGTCQGNAPSITAAWREIAAIAQLAFYRTDAANKAKLPSASEMRVTYNTFQSYFGSHPVGDNVAATVATLLSKSFC